MREGDGSPRWCKSSSSAAGDCVEWLILPNVVRVRDSKQPDGVVLSFTPSEWRAFVRGVRNGEADLEPGEALREGA